MQAATGLGLGLEPRLSSWLSRLQLNRGTSIGPRGVRDLELDFYLGESLTVLKLSASGVSDLRFRNPPNMVTMAMASFGRFRGTVGARSFSAVPNRCSLVLLPDELLRLDGASPTLAGLVVQLPARLILQECRRQAAPDPDLRLLADVLPGQEALIHACCQQLLQLAAQPNPAARVRLAEPLEASIVGVMANLLVGCWQRPQRVQEDPYALHVERALAYMERHLGEVIALKNLCDACHISPRTLQVSFQKIRGCTPLQALQEIRMIRLRTHLLQGVELRKACAQVGLPPSGRMAANYKRQFGELPSQTRQRAGGAVIQAGGLSVPEAGCDAQCSGSRDHGVGG